jgi:hypothetical protein
MLNREEIRKEWGERADEGGDGEEESSNIYRERERHIYHFLSKIKI